MAYLAPADYAGHDFQALREPESHPSPLVVARWAQECHEPANGATCEGVAFQAAHVPNIVVSSEEFVGEFWLRKLAEHVNGRPYRDPPVQSAADILAKSRARQSHPGAPCQSHHEKAYGYRTKLSAPRTDPSVAQFTHWTLGVLD